MKKLIFIRNGKEDLDQLCIRITDDKIVNPLGIDDYLYDIDRDIRQKGFKKTLQDGVIENQSNEWYITSYPAVLNWHVFWFDKTTQRHQIYFIENGKLINIHDINSFRPSQVVEKPYLSDWFGKK